MARKARLSVPEVPYHITARANFGRFIFNSDKDRRLYATLFQENAQRQGVEVYAWCIMGNHVHFVIEPKAEDSMAELFRVLQQRYSRYVNKKSNTYGQNWQGRFYSSPLDVKHLYEAIRYVELNPVRAKITDDIENYKWSSAKGRFDGQHEIRIDSVEQYLEIEDWREYLSEAVDEESVQNIRLRTQLGLPSQTVPVTGLIRVSYSVLSSCKTSFSANLLQPLSSVDFRQGHPIRTTIHFCLSLHGSLTSCGIQKDEING